MKVFSIGDLHLSFANPKPMDIFGDHWGNHAEIIARNWRERVEDEDVVLIPGDISWAMQFEDALVDLTFIGKLPGQKVIIKGNHDYWWNSISKLRDALPVGMYALQNDHKSFKGFTVCGSRGWVCPGAAHFVEQDRKIYDREVGRLNLSLQNTERKPGELLIAMMHFPPFDEKQNASGFSALFEAFNVDYVLYGHLHGKSCYNAFEGKISDVQYNLVSCDFLNFIPKLIAEV